jgi:hypothetical protein
MSLNVCASRPRSRLYANGFLAEERSLALKRLQTEAARLASVAARRLYRERIEERPRAHGAPR